MIRELSQFFTPMWAAEAIVERYFAHLGASDLVLEPSCGEGPFLAALPAHVPAVGVEIDARLANIARRTGRPVIDGDFRSVPLTLEPTAVIGNPPFVASVFDGFLERAHQLLPEGALAGFVLPAYMMQTPSRVDRYNERWSITAELLPRTLWPRLSKPVTFCLFRKDRQRVLVGFALYAECASVERLSRHYRELLTKVSRSAWGTAVAEALINLGGEATLDTIYRAMEGRRPTTNQFWKDKVRQVLQARFTRTGPARYAIPLQEAA